MYTVTSAARISQTSLARLFWKAAAVPWKLARMLGGIPIDDGRRLQPLVLLVGGHVAQLRPGPELFEETGGEGRQLRRVRVFEGVLELRAADPALHGQVLHGLHVEGDSLDLLELRLQAPDDL